ncbi:hypothetical protein [Streptomyces sp. NPDC059009]|uniref:hypothetical protein n=1 Tax=Streptomyces sp. NPDC059009 TaxID=3346694 RepID=UPI0036A424F0
MKDTDTTAAEERAKAQESYERSDTDGFVSQWAHGVMAAEREVQAEVDENGGVWDFRAIFTAADLKRADGAVIPAGTPIPAVREQGKWGFTWIVFNAEARALLGSKYLNESTSRNPDRERAANAKKGFYLGTVRVPAEADTIGGGRGLAGATSVTVVPVRVDGGFSADAEIIDNGQ